MKKTTWAPVLLLCMVLCCALLPVTALAADPVAINKTTFPDDNFRIYVEDQVDKDVSGSLSSDEIAAVTTIDLQYEGEIETLKGIEFFTALKTLKCSGRGIKEMDLSANAAMTSVDCSNNKLTSLDVSANANLKTLICSNNQLTTLTLGELPALTTLDCSYNELPTLDVSGCPALKKLSCQSNALTALNVKTNTALALLNCCDNKLTALSVSANTALTELDCSDNQLTALNVTKNTALKVLGCSWNQITALNVTKNSKLQQLSCDNNKLTALNVKENTALKDLSCRKNALTSLNVTNNTALTQLFCEGNNISKLDIRSIPALTKAYAQGTRHKEGGAVHYELYKESSSGQITYYLSVPAAASVSVASAAPRITTQPTALTVKAGAKATFKVKASGGGLKYQWYYQKPGASTWAKITENGTAASYTVKTKKSMNGYKYMCKILNGLGSVKTKAVKLTVK